VAAAHHPQARPLSPAKCYFIEKIVWLNILAPLQTKYLEVLFCHHNPIGQQPIDLNKTNMQWHDVELKTGEPIYTKLFKIPDAHQEAGRGFGLRLIQPACSKFNSPILVLAKKDGSIQLVRDFWALNANTLPLTVHP